MGELRVAWQARVDMLADPLTKAGRNYYRTGLCGDCVQEKLVLPKLVGMFYMNGFNNKGKRVNP